VAAHLDPEILLVDEVLAVGDAAFQKKCLGKMGEVAREGRTVLFVSHNMAAIKNICQRSLLLDRGQVNADGDTTEVIRIYLEEGAKFSSEYHAPQVPADLRASLVSVRILNTKGQPVSQVGIHEPFILEIKYLVTCPGVKLNLSVSVFSQDGIYVFASPSLTDIQWFQKPHPRGLFRSLCFIPANTFNRGRYDFTILLVEGGRRILQQLDKIVSVEMIDLGYTSGGYFGYWGGVVRPILEWSTEYVGE
jgi:lipopolysaccharide transport system ATP-binding protein